jgi:hypothetical protein
LFFIFFAKIINYSENKMKNYQIDFLTSNEKKAKDFVDFGLGVKEFSQEITEVLAESVETVVLYKAKDTKLNNILVEDTAL